MTEIWVPGVRFREEKDGEVTRFTISDGDRHYTILCDVPQQACWPVVLPLLMERLADWRNDPTLFCTYRKSKAA